MARPKVVVYFDDGTEATFNPNRPRLLLDMENKFGVQSPERHEHIAWLAYHALVVLKGNADTMPFDKWIDTVEEFDASEAQGQVDDDEGKADPS